MPRQIPGERGGGRGADDGDGDGGAGRGRADDGDHGERERDGADGGYGDADDHRRRHLDGAGAEREPGERGGGRGADDGHGDGGAGRGRADDGDHGDSERWGHGDGDVCDGLPGGEQLHADDPGEPDERDRDVHVHPDDSAAESAETVILSGSATGLETGTATLTITDDDTSTALELSVSPESVADAGPTTVTVTAALDGAARTTATTVTVSDGGTGTATSATDYQAVNNFTLTIPANQTSGTGTFTFTPTNDSAAESAETVILSGSATGLTGDTATLTITDDDTSTALELSVSPESVAEDAGPTTVTVTAALDGAARTTATTVTVSDGGTGTATSATDYQAVNNFTLTIPANQTSGTGTFTFTPTNDSAAESAETVILSGSATGLQIGMATLTITDDDTSTALELSVSPESVAEDAGPTTVTVTAALDGAARTTATTVTVSDGGTGTATSATDYQAVNNFTLTIPANQTSGTGTFTFTPTNDSAAESAETVILSGSATGLTGDTATLTITDDDTSTALELSVSPESVAEDAGPTTVTVTAALDGAARTTATTVTVSDGGTGTATSATDYQAVNNFTLTIPANQTSGTGTFTFTPTNDSAAESAETVILSGSATGLTGDTATLTIADDDTSTALELSVSPESVAEDAGPTTVTVTAALDGAARTTATTVTVSDGGTGTATSATDYTAVNNFTLTIPANQTSGTGTFTFTPTNDSAAESAETVILSGSATGLETGMATLTITDDDTSTVLELSVSPESVAEDAGPTTVTVTAKLDQGARTVPTNVVVTLSSQEVGFGPGQDAAVVEPFTITIEPGRTGASRSFTLQPQDDTLAEGTESIEVRGEAIGLRVESATLELTDNDTATVNLAVPYVSRHSEGGGAIHVTVEATLDAIRSADTIVTVQVRGSGRSGVVGFEAVAPFELTIPAGERRNAEGGFMLYPEYDDEAEEDETLTISGRASGLRVTSATFLLEDDDSESASTKVTLELSETRLAESEGTHFDLTVTGTLDGAAREQDTVVTLEATNSSSDGSQVSALVDSGMRLTIRAGRISGQRTFGIVLNTLGIDQADGRLTLGGTADGLAVEPATLELLDGDDAPDLITLTLSETRVPEGWRGTVRVLAEMTPSARAEDTVVTLSVAGTGGSGSVGFQPVEPFELTIPKGYEAYGASFDLLTERDGQPRRDQTLTVSGTVAVAGLQVRSATLTLVDTDVAQALDFAYFANGDATTSEMVLLNVAPHPIQPVIYFSDRGGNPIAPASVVEVTRDLRITDDGGLTVWTETEPLGMLTISTHGQGALVSGSVTVRSDGPISGILRYHVPEIGAAAMGAGDPVRDALFPVRSQAGGIPTAAALHNLEAEAIGVRCRLMSGGVTLEEVAIPLAANGQTSWFIEDAFTTTETSNFLGVVRCTAAGEGRFTAVALEMDTGNRIFTAVPVVPVDHTGGGGGATVLDFAEFANGTGITTDLVFVNPSTQPSGAPRTPVDAAIPPSRPVMYFYDTQGNPIAPASVVTLTSDLRITDDGGLTVWTEMAPLGVLTIATHGQGELRSGSVRVVSDGPLAGFLRVGLPPYGVGVVVANPPVSEALFPVRRQEGGSNTRVAMHNLESSPGLLHCDLMREGVLRDSASIPLEANGQTSWLIDQAFPATDTSDFTGSVRCDAVGEGLFSAVALEMDPGNRIFATLPVVPVPQMPDRE